MLVQRQTFCLRC